MTWCHSVKWDVTFCFRLVFQRNGGKIPTAEWGGGWGGGVGRLWSGCLANSQVQDSHLVLQMQVYFMTNNATLLELYSLSLSYTLSQWLKKVWSRNQRPGVICLKGCGETQNCFYRSLSRDETAVIRMWKGRGLLPNISFFMLPSGSWQLIGLLGTKCS